MSGAIILILLIVGFFIIRTIYKFRNELKEDNDELKKQSLEDMFSYLIDGLNEYCYLGHGEITKIGKQTLNIYKQSSCQIINLLYGTGILTITWKFKYYQQEMIYKRNLSDARKPSIEWQKNALNLVISEFLEEYQKHEEKVISSGIIKEILSDSNISEENYKKAKDFLK